MAARYRVALHGFSEFERSALAFCLKHAGARVPAYEQAEGIADSDFIVADASQPPIEGSVLRGQRLADTLFVGDAPPRGAAAQLPRPLDPERILRALDRIVIQRLAARSQAAPPAGLLPMPPQARPRPLPIAPPPPDTVPDTMGVDSGFEIRFTDLGALDEALDAPEGAAAPTPPSARLPADTLAPPPAPLRSLAPPGSPTTTEADRRAAKEAARRKSRAARLEQVRSDGQTIEDVLLLDGLNQAAALELLLEGFGFRVLRATDIAGAISVLESTPVAAAFLDMAAQGDEGLDGLALCQLVKRRRLLLPDDAPPVLLLSCDRAASEGVRARLAGCDAYLTLPAGRGDVARALEACNVALPADARRTTR
jgi:CheY-like chemotaxis protein